MSEIYLPSKKIILNNNKQTKSLDGEELYLGRV